MAKGKANVSSSGASMSKYDVEVEARLTALEKAVADIAAKCDDRASSGGSDGRVDKLIDWMTSVPTFANEMPNHYNEETGEDDRHLDF